MEKDFDFSHNNYSGDTVIGRGYEIYSEWKTKRVSSRRIVSLAERAVSSAKVKNTYFAYIEALSCIFALDMRIKERYKSILRCIFRYFSWRRESGALKRLKLSIHIDESLDIRTAIEVELQRLREKLECEESDDGDDVKGGKRNGKSEEAAASEEKQTEEEAKENPEADELADKEEAEKDSNEKEENSIEEAPHEEVSEEIGEINETAELQQNEVEKTATNEKTELAEENNENLKEENNMSDLESEMNTNKKEDAKVYNDAVDSPPLYEETVRERSSEQTPFIDEMIIDNMVKGDKNIVGYQQIDEIDRNKKADILQDTVSSQNESNKSIDKDGYLYDEMMLTYKGKEQQTLNVESTKQPEKVSEAKTEQLKETVQNNGNVNSTKQEFNPLREMPQSNNLNVDLDNNIVDALNINMSLDSKMAIIRMKEDQLREHMTITLEELGMNDTPEVLRVSEPDTVNSPSVTQNRK